VDLEAIALAIVQALQRKRYEEDIREAYGNLQMKFKELQVQSEELHKTNEMLLESERHFHKMANTIPQLAWIAHPDGYIYWYNERRYSYTGTTPEQMGSWGWQSVMTQERCQKCRNNGMLRLLRGRCLIWSYLCAELMKFSPRSSRVFCP